jgi:hypothetical protein
MSMKEGWVYLLREKDFLTGEIGRYLKIGLTERDVPDRVKEHQTGNAREVISVYEKHVPLMSAMENHLHHVFSSDRINGEWFDLDDDRVQNELVPMVERLAKEQAETKAHKQAAAELKKQYDNGTVRDPTAAETALHEAYLTAKHAHTLAKARHAIDDAKVRALIGTAESIEGVVQVKPKSQNKHFNKAAFLKSLTPGEFALCHQTVTEFKAGSPKIVGVKNLKSLDVQLDADKKAAEKAITAPPSLSNIGGGETARTADAEQAHASYLASRKAVREAEWDAERYAAALAVAIGEDREITGVVSWIREDVTTEDKWDADLAKTHLPEKYEAFRQERPDIVEVKINEGHPY